jgi:hypothetical protein
MRSRAATLCEGEAVDDSLMPTRSLVSTYWTPEHLDVTDAPSTYAPPKPSWLEGFDALREHVTTTSEDRMLRRRLQEHSLVTDPGELALLPSSLAVWPLQSEHRSRLCYEFIARIAEKLSVRVFSHRLFPWESKEQSSM